MQWRKIGTVLLDMDGTLLDKYFDDYFWEEFLPQVYGKQNNLQEAEAQKVLYRRYRSVEKTLLWTDLNYWTEELDLDIIGLKKQIAHLISINPHVIDFLQRSAPPAPTSWAGPKRMCSSGTALKKGSVLSVNAPSSPMTMSMSSTRPAATVSDIWCTSPNRVPGSRHVTAMNLPQCPPLTNSSSPLRIPSLPEEIDLISISFVFLHSNGHLERRISSR